MAPGVKDQFALLQTKNVKWVGQFVGWSLATPNVVVPSYSELTLEQDHELLLNAPKEASPVT